MKAKGAKCLLRQTQMCLEGKNIMQVFFVCFPGWKKETCRIERGGREIGLLNKHPWKQSEKAMAPHSSSLAWKISWVEEPGGLQSVRLLKVRHD